MTQREIRRRKSGDGCNIPGRSQHLRNGMTCTERPMAQRPPLLHSSENKSPALYGVYGGAGMEHSKWLVSILLGNF